MEITNGALPVTILTVLRILVRDIKIALTCYVRQRKGLRYVIKLCYIQTYTVYRWPLRLLKENIRLSLY